MSQTNFSSRSPMSDVGLRQRDLNLGCIRQALQPDESRTLPRTPPSAQAMEARPIFCGELMFGFTNAYLDSAPSEILDEILMENPVAGRVTYLPDNAATWREVHRVDFPHPLHVQCPLPYDLRQTRWEYFDEIRVIPVMLSTSLQNNVIVPVSLLQAHSRDCMEQLIMTHTGN